jgi:flagellar basal-body rod protein FlgG
MLQALYTGASGLTGQQKNIDVIANNVSNLNTGGYKASRFDFQDCLYLRMLSPTDNSPEKNLQRGAGAIEYQTARIFHQGALSVTGRTLDFALEGQGFFIVENPNPLEENMGLDEVLYTRDGSFYISPEAEGETGGFLVDSAGRYILDADRNRIYIPDPSRLSVGEDGSLSHLSELGEVIEIGVLGVTDFVNRMGLADTGNNLFMATDNSGEELEELSVKVLGGSLESSNVNYSGEVTRLIRAQRAYQLASRVITTADQMMGLANTIRQ